jgi:hypothetical protein
MKLPFEFKVKEPKTWFIDLDGTVIEHNLVNSAMYKDRLLPGVKELWESFGKKDRIILVTSRPKYLKKHTKKFLNKHGIWFDKIIFKLPRGERIIINDIKPSGAETALAWNVERNKGFK